VSADPQTPALFPKSGGSGSDKLGREDGSEMLCRGKAWVSQGLPSYTHRP